MAWISKLCGGCSCSIEEEKSTGNWCNIHDTGLEKCHQKEKEVCPTVCKKQNCWKLPAQEKVQKFSHKGAQEGNQRVLDEENRSLKAKTMGNFSRHFDCFLSKSKGSNAITLETEENSAETDESIISIN